MGTERADVVFPIAEFVGRDIGRALGRKIDEDLTVGTGTGQPNGLMTAITGSGTIATGGSLITPTYEKLVDLQYSIADSYRASPACGWLMRDSTAGTLRKLRDGGGGTVGAVKGCREDGGCGAASTPRDQDLTAGALPPPLVHLRGVGALGHRPDGLLDAPVPRPHEQAAGR